MDGGLNSRRIAIAGLALLFAAVFFYAYRSDRTRPASPLETAPTAPVSTPIFGAAPPRPALTAEEEAFVSSLWAVHEVMRLNAAKMSFAGLYYKSGDIKKEDVRARVAPLTAVFQEAEGKLQSIPTPASMATYRDQYLQAVQSFEHASVEMVKVAEDGDDAHLHAAHERSQAASNTLLKISDALWPGEFKPH